jgi:CHAD domain-containing protein
MPQPVNLFLQQNLTLKEAISVCIQAPTPKRVHRLRTSTRRIEATLELLTLTVDISKLKKRSKPLRRSLRKLRRAAGEVRDYDVHYDLLKAYGRTHDTQQLFDHLTTAREKAAHSLENLLHHHQEKVTRRLDDLESLIHPALDLDLSGAKLMGLVRSWFADEVSNLDPEQDEDLHTLRKAAKTARYLAETGTKSSKAVAAVAHRFEAAQKTLGEWHDHLLLLQEANATLPKDSDTVVQIQHDMESLHDPADTVAKQLLAKM